MTDEEAVRLAQSMTPLQRKVILLCSREKSWGYGPLAEKAETSYASVQDFGHFLQRKKLAFVSPVRRGREFAGSAIFLNERGEHVRMAVEIIERKLSNAPNN